MKKALGHLCALLKGILFIGFSIQIVLGLIWMCFHFAGVQKFGAPEGFLYPMLLKCFGSVPQVLYLLQLGLAGYAGNLILKPFGKQGVFWQSWQVLALLTLPVAMQCHLALLPYSFVSSLLFLEVYFCRGAMRERDDVDVTELAKGACCHLALSLLLPEYVWLGGIPLMLVVLLRLPALVKRMRKLTYCILLLAAIVGIAAGTDSLIRSEEDYRGSFWFSMASRIAWPTISNDSQDWSDELEAVVKPVYWEITYSPGNMERLLRPVVEDAVGEEQAQVFYREMVERAWPLQWPKIIRQMGWDVLTLVLPQAVLQMQLIGRGYDSYSGRNYEIMLEGWPMLTKYYVDYSCWWFIVMLGTAAMLAVFRLLAGERLYSQRALALPAVCALSAGVITLYYTMRGAGIADYKSTLALSSVWTVGALQIYSGQGVDADGGTVDCMEKERRSENE